MSETESVKIEDIIQHAMDKGVLLPKKQIEYMRNGLESEKISPDYLKKTIDRVSEAMEKKGYRWEDKSPEALANEDPEKNHTVSRYCEGNGNVLAFITECTVKDHKDDPSKNGSKFYSATKIDRGAGENGKDLYTPMGAQYNRDGLKNSVTAYYTQVEINTVQEEIKNERKSKWIPSKDITPEKATEPELVP